MTANHASAGARQPEPFADDYVVGTLNFAPDEKETLEWFMHNPAPGIAEKEPQLEPRLVRIADARASAEEFGIDTAGFQLMTLESDVVDFHNEADVKSVYYSETENLVKQATGASRVLVFDHNLRSTDFNAEGTVLRKPSNSVHGDYTDVSAPRRIRQMVPAGEADALLKKRYAFINVWKPLEYQVESDPLVLCDARSMNEKDFVRASLRYTDRTGEIYNFKYNANQRWYYYRHMQTDEAILIKCYDSDTSGRARHVAHTSFEDSSSPADARPRISIEVRTAVFFD